MIKDTKFKKGMVPWNKGMKRKDWISDDMEKKRRIKISNSLKKAYEKGERISYFKGKSLRKGIKLTKEQIENMSKRMSFSDFSTRISLGYRLIKINGSWVKEHRYIWCRDSDWGFIPKGYVVHHINEDKLDNRIENLACIPSDYHTELHWYLKKRGVC